MDKSFIKILIEAKPKELSVLYHNNRDAFLNFGKQYGLDYDDLTDIYQEAFIAIRERALNGKLETVKSSFKTYLFGIGKFMIYDWLRKQKKTTSLNGFFNVVKDGIDEIKLEENTTGLSKEQLLLKKFFIQLGKKCQKLLTLFYVNGLNIEEIFQTTDYNSNAVVRSQKSRCIKMLREMIQSYELTKNKQFKTNSNNK